MDRAAGRISDENVVAECFGEGKYLCFIRSLSSSLSLSSTSKGDSVPLRTYSATAGYNILDGVYQIFSLAANSLQSSGHEPRLVISGNGVVFHLLPRAKFLPRGV